MSDNFTLIRGKSGTAQLITARPAWWVFWKKAQNATISAWLLHLPGQHPLWCDYELAVVHLRPLPGTPPAAKRYPEAEYEIDMMALDPQGKPNANNLESLLPLMPLNYSVQFDGITDVQAAAICERLAARFVDGKLLAEPEGIQGARQLFTQTLRRLCNDARFDRQAKEFLGY